MDWELAITRNKAALLRLLALWLASMQRFAEDGAVVTLPRYVHGNILRLLRPAESALRRLIVVMAQGIAAAPRPKRPAPKGLPRGRRDQHRIPAFPLFDRRKRFGVRPKRSGSPGVGVFFDADDLAGLPLVERRRLLAIQRAAAERRKPKPQPAPEDRVDAGALCRRLQSVQRALNNLPREARRMARAVARRAHAPPGPGRVPPLRPGLPPGYRQRPLHGVDSLLRECHTLAQMRMSEATAASLKPG